MKKNKVITFISIFVLAQVLIWFQTYGQFKWEWLGQNTWLLLLAAMPITYLWIIGTRVGMDVFDGKSWPLRFVGFCTGIIVFAVLSRLVLGEVMGVKTMISLGLCCLIILIQFL
jgi:hypothetical protein